MEAVRDLLSVVSLFTSLPDQYVDYIIGRHYCLHSTRSESSGGAAPTGWQADKLTGGENCHGEKRLLMFVAAS